MELRNLPGAHLNSYALPRPAHYPTDTPPPNEGNLVSSLVLFLSYHLAFVRHNW